MGGSMSARTVGVAWSSSFSPSSCLYSFCDPLPRVPPLRPDSRATLRAPGGCPALGGDRLGDCKNRVSYHPFNVGRPARWRRPVSDFTPDDAFGLLRSYSRHIQFVREGLKLVTDELERRGVVHDASKM